MDKKPDIAAVEGSTVPALRVYAMAGICLVVGLAIGYVFRGSLDHSTAGQIAAHEVAARPGMAAGHVPTLEEMKHMADTQAAPLLDKLKGDPNNGALLLQVGSIYHAAHQYPEAGAYFGRAVQTDPKNVVYRTKLALSLYRGGDPDGAIAQLNQALSNDPNDANALFDLGMIRMEGKHDSRGALAAWQKLLKTNPGLSPDRKATVQKLIANVMTSAGERRATRSNNP